jgi:integrase
MGVYRRKNKQGDPYGPWIIQYPAGIDPRTGRTRYASERVSHQKKVADLTLGKRMLDWEKKKHLGLEKKKEYTFRELVDWYLGLPKVKAKKTYKDDKGKAEILKEEFGNYFAREIKPAMIESFQHNLLNRPCKKKKKKNYAPASANRILAVIKRIYNLAVREEYVERNPCLKVTMLPENNKRDRVITKEEFERLVSKLPKHTAQMVTVAYYTGMRAGEIFNLTWDKVNLKEGVIDLDAADTKTSAPRSIYLNEILHGLFKELAKVRHIGHARVFTYHGKPVKRIFHSFKSGCAAAGLKDFRFHDLRHTFNTNMRKAGVDRSVIMKITGHKTMSMFERYNTVDSDDALMALRRLDAFLAGAGNGKASYCKFTASAP